MGYEVLSVLSVAVFFISFFILITSKNIIKSTVSVAIMQTAVIMFFLAMNYFEGAMSPIVIQEVGIEGYADALPQALMITAIVIGFSVTAINIIMMNTLFRKYDTSDWGKLFKLAKEDYSIKDGRCPDDFAACADKEEEDLNA